MVTNLELRECFKCKWLDQTAETRCPRCGGKLHGPRQIRTRGIIQLITGLFLVVFMGAIAVFVSGSLAIGMKNPESAKRINEQASMLLIIYAIFGAVIVFGLHGTVMGVWQIVTGRRNRVLIWIMWALLFVLFFIGGAFMALSKN